MTAAELITDALQELGAYGAKDDPTAEDAALGLVRLNRIIDDWNAERQSIYAEVVQSYTITPSLQPHTIGPTGTFTVDTRPVSIEGASLLVSGVIYTLDLRSTAWFEQLATPSLTSTIPVALNYRPAFPNGSIYFWPIPTSAATLHLRVRTVLSSYALTTTIALPPGYEDALMLTLAESLAGPMRLPVSPTTERLARQARARIQANNTIVPDLITRDSGMPGGRGGFDNYTGRVL